MKFNEIGIIGFGPFGEYLAKEFSKISKVYVWNRSDKRDVAKKIGVEYVSLEEVCSKKIIIISVSMGSFEKVINLIKDKVKEGSLVMDVCSLKVFSCDLMKENFNNINVDIVGTHSLFGSNSAPNGFKDKNLVLCNVRCNYFNEVVSFFEKLEPKIFIKTPQEHDEQMAYSQALTHFIGRTFEKIDKQNIELKTKTYEDLLDIVKIINKDSKDLFYNMQKLNPYSKKIRENFIKSMDELNRELN